MASWSIPCSPQIYDASNIRDEIVHYYDVVQGSDK